MINSWSLLYDELYGDDEMNTSDFTVGVSTESFGDNTFFIDPGDIDNITIDTSNYDTWSGITSQTFTTDIDSSEYANDYPTATAVASEGLGGFDTLNISLPDEYPSAFTALSDNDDAIAHHVGGQVSSGINNPCARKYKEDESIEALKNYISTTYGGHYTSDTNDVQTLDLIESVGDAESFCRSNAIKYLSRYDKKGQAKRDILKALHYSLLLYHFSGQLNETPTRGYETF